jgi:prepilin signal peptidase PulO-like enzyme (type II secretory pathway)
MGIDLIIYQKLSELLSNNFAFICLIALIFLIINALNKETFYGGDVKLILVLSLILGTKISYILLYSGVINVFLHIVTRKEKIPFAPSIFAAIIFFWGDYI